MFKPSAADAFYVHARKTTRDFNRFRKHYPYVYQQIILNLHQYRFFGFHSGHEMLFGFLKFTVILKHEGVFIMNFGQTLRISRPSQFEREIEL